MKKIVLILVFVSAVFSSISFDNKKGKFTQKIVNDLGKEIIYTGEIFIDGENLLWKYKTPLEKSILIKGSEVVITEPEIYQITVVRREEGINLKKIYDSSKAKSKSIREVMVDGVLMELHEGEEFIKKILFKDKLDNSVSIEFSAIESGEKNAAHFTAHFPDDFDVVYR